MRPVSSALMEKASQALTAAGLSPEAVQAVSGNPALAASAAQYLAHARTKPEEERNTIAQPWQVEAYRHVKICGEARYAAVLFSNMGARAEMGVSEPQVLRDKPKWVNEGPEVEAFAQLAPTVRDRTKMIRDYLLHHTIAGECYLIARERQPTDFGYVDPPGEFKTWDEWTTAHNESIDLLDPEAPDASEITGNPNADNPVWEIVAVTELRRTGTGVDAIWSVRHDNDSWLDLKTGDPVIRLWNPDPEKRREAWSPFQALLPTLREIEWLTMHIFTQVRSRLMSAGVWFLPDNLTYPPPPPGTMSPEAYATLNDAERFQVSLAASSMRMLDADEPSFPTIVMADPEALQYVDQEKLIKFWSEIDDKAMILRSDAIRRLALGMDMPPEQTLGSSGIAVSGTSGSAGSVNHWGEWAKEEQTIENHVVPALDNFCGTLTQVLRAAVEGTLLIIAYGTNSMRSRQDRSKESMEMADRGWLKPAVALRENGFDPDTDMPNDEEQRLWLLMKIVSGQYAPEQMAVAAQLMGVKIPDAVVSGNPGDPKEVPGKDLAPSLEDHPYEGPPRGDHDHNPAPYAVEEVLVLRAMEKYGNRLLNGGKRGKDRDRDTPATEAHLTASIGRTVIWSEFDFSLAEQVGMGHKVEALGRFAARLYNEGQPFTREALTETLGAA